jgi:hypothetical protein
MGFDFVLYLCLYFVLLPRSLGLKQQIDGVPLWNNRDARKLTVYALDVLLLVTRAVHAAACSCATIRSENKRVMVPLLIILVMY